MHLHEVRRTAPHPVNRRLLLLPLALLAAAALPATTAHSVRAEPTFSEPVVVVPPLKAEMGEPRLAVGPDGSVALSAHLQGVNCETGMRSVEGRLCVWLSRDGRRFTLAGGEPTGQQGVDVDIALLPQSNTMVISNMTNVGAGTGVGGTTVSRSTDNGRSWEAAVAANYSAFNDRPWLLVDSEQNLLLTWADLGTGAILAARSSDGGATFGAPIPVLLPPTQAFASMNGTPFKDHARNELVIPIGSGTAPSCPIFSGVSGCLDTVTFARSSDGGATWRRAETLRLPTGTGTTSVITAAADAAGREFLAVGTVAGFSGVGAGTGESRVLLYTSAGQGEPFRMQQLSRPTTSAMVPTVSAGPAGTVAVSWYSTPFPDGGSVPRPWRLMVAWSNDGGLTWREGEPHQPEAAYIGQILDHQRSIWDVNGTVVDTDGRIHLAWTSLLGKPSGSPSAVLYARSKSIRGPAPSRTGAAPNVSPGPASAQPLAAAPPTLPVTGTSDLVAAMAALPVTFGIALALYRRPAVGAGGRRPAGGSRRCHG